MERVSTYQGGLPALIVAPHGFDDSNTTIIAETIIQNLNCYGVINRSWKRAADYDYYANKANCNNIQHIHQDVVREEFCEPLLNFSAFAPNVFIIHGVGNSIRKTKGAENLDVIVGYGAGKPASYTAGLAYRHTFMSLLGNMGLTVFRGKAGGSYAGHSSNNLNQTFRNHYLNMNVFSLQIEIVTELRANAKIAVLTGEVLATAISKTIEHRLQKTKFDSNVQYPTI